MPNHSIFPKYVHKKINVHLNCLSKNKGDAFRSAVSHAVMGSILQPLLSSASCCQKARSNVTSAQLIACRGGSLVDKQAETEG